MITELFKKQADTLLRSVYDNIGSFVKKFFNEEYEYLENINYYVTFGSDHVFIQKYWTNDQGQEFRQEAQVSFDDYNTWLGEL